MLLLAVQGYETLLKVPFTDFSKINTRTNKPPNAGWAHPPTFDASTVTSPLSTMCVRPIE
jgi:hypothetical protein